MFKYKRHYHWLNAVLQSDMDREILQCCCIIYICIERGVIIRFTGSLNHHYLKFHCRLFKRLPKECPKF